MSEKMTPSKHEKQPSAESHEAREQLDKLGEKLSKDAEKAGEKDQNKEAHEARKSVEKHALTSKETQGKESEKKRDKEHAPKAIRKQNYKATMNRVEAQLPAYQRTFSKVLRNPTVDKVSNVASKTVARPSALLGAGVVAVIGLAIATYYANSVGFELSPSLFVFLVGLGWAFGLFAELITKPFRKTTRR